MDWSKPRPLLCFVAATLAGPLEACSVNGEGLLGVHDGSTGGAAGVTVCPSGLTDQAGWPANTADTSCVRTCGPDGIGLQQCHQTDQATCQKASGCVCLEGPCVACEDCAFLALPDCYVPENAATAPLCADGVVRQGACAPACGKRLCMHKDGKTACLCNSEGRYACADWGDSGWQ
jgi:hypothetical protein